MDCGPPRIDASEIVRLVSKYVCPLVPKQRGGIQGCRGVLTNALFSALTTCSQNTHYQVRHKQKGLKRDDPRREFLWDYTWTGQDAELVLAMESEWSGIGHRVVGDFKKLLYAKCRMKVLVYGEQRQNLDARQMIDRCVRSFPVHTVGEQYLIINVRGWASGCLEASLYTIRQHPSGFCIDEERIKPDSPQFRVASATS